MSGIVATTPPPDSPFTVPFGFAKALLEASKTPIWLADRGGRVLVANESARNYDGAREASEQWNVFSDVLKVDASLIEQRIAAGEHEMELELAREENRPRARVQWVADA